MYPTDHENMFLRDRYYQIKDMQLNASDGLFTVSIMPESTIFNGHFPDNPICPGVCGIEIIHECTCILTGWKLKLSNIKLCRFTAIARPEQCKDITVYIHTRPIPSEDSFFVEASVTDESDVFINFKGMMRL